MEKLINVIPEIKSNFDVIKPSNNIINQFNDLTFIWIKRQDFLLHSFTQVRKNSEFSGLVSESMILTERHLLDLTIGQDNFEIISIPVKYIKRVHLKTIPSYYTAKDERGFLKKKIDYKSRLDIYSGDNDQYLAYEVSSEKYGEIFQMYEAILKTV